MKTSLISLAAVAALLASSIAFAAPPTFKKADSNGDGSIDAAEFENAKIENFKFDALDKDGDGSLSKGEYAAALEEDCA